MVPDAEAHADDDKRQRELAEARNDAEHAAYQAERQLKELGDAVDDSSRSEIEAAIKGSATRSPVRTRRRSAAARTS